MLEVGDEGGRLEALRHARRLSGVRDDHRCVGDDRPAMRRREIGGVDADAVAKLLLGQVGRRFYRCRRAALLRQARRQGQADRAAGGEERSEEGSSARHENSSPGVGGSKVGGACAARSNGSGAQPGSLYERAVGNSGPTPGRALPRGPAVKLF